MAMRSGESVDALRRLFDGAAAYTVRNVGRGLVNINARTTEATPAIGSRMTANSADLVVTSVDKHCIYAAHVSGGMPHVGDEASSLPDSDRLLFLPKTHRHGDIGRRFGTPWRSGNYLLDLTRALRKGHTCAILGGAGTGKSAMASRLRGDNCVVVCATTTQKQYDVKETVTVDPDHWGAPQHAWLAPLRGLHRAIELSRVHEDVTLILDDISLLHQLHQSAERPFFTVAQVMNAISAYAGLSEKGHISIALVVDGAPEDEIWQAAESVSDVTLNFDSVPSRPFWPLAGPGSQDTPGRVARDLFTKLRDGGALKEKLHLFRDLKMHVDFWENDEVTSIDSATAILNQYGDASTEHYAKEMMILARACAIFHFPRMEKQEVTSFIKTLFRMCNEDGIFDHDISVDALDQALLRYRNHIDILRPSF